MMALPCYVSFCCTATNLLFLINFFFILKKFLSGKLKITSVAHGIFLLDSARSGSNIIFLLLMRMEKEETY